MDEIYEEEFVRVGVQPHEEWTRTVDGPDDALFEIVGTHVDLDFYLKTATIALHLPMELFKQIVDQGTEIVAKYG